MLDKLGTGALCESEAQLPRTVLVEFESDPSELETNQLKLLTDSGSHGIVVLDAEKKVAGVVTFQSMLCSSMTRSSDSLMVANVAGTLSGDPNTGPARLKCLRSGCSFVNRIHYIDDNHLPPCGNKLLPIHPHTFQMEGGA